MYRNLKLIQLFEKKLVYNNLKFLEYVRMLGHFNRRGQYRTWCVLYVFVSDKKFFFVNSYLLLFFFFFLKRSDNLLTDLREKVCIKIIRFLPGNIPTIRHMNDREMKRISFYFVVYSSQTLRHIVRTLFIK